MKKLVIILCLSVFVLGSVTLAGRNIRETRKIDIEGATSIDLEVDFGAGEIRIYAKDMTEAAEIELFYNPNNVEYEIDYHVKRSTGHLYIDSDTDFNHDDDFDTDENQIDIALSTDNPISLNFDIGACKAEFDLGGIPITMLDLDVGAASGYIEWSEPNPVRLEEINIDAGAASLEMVMIGNANFDFMTLEGGAGSFDLDFRGEYNGESEIEIEISVGSADIILPKNVPIRVEADDDGWFSSIDFHGDNLERVRNGVYESPDFDDADTRIIISIDVSMGSVDLYWKR